MADASQNYKQANKLKRQQQRPTCFIHLSPSQPSLNFPMGMIYYFYLDFPGLTRLPVATKAWNVINPVQTRSYKCTYVDF